MTVDAKAAFRSGASGYKATLFTVLIVVICFFLGLLAAHLTSFVPEIVAAATSSPAPENSAEVPEPLEPDPKDKPVLTEISRDLDDADKRAGITTLKYEERGNGVLTPVHINEQPDDSDRPIRRVAILVEEHITISPKQFSNYVMEILNDPKGWSGHEGVQYVQTDGVADFRIVLASPYTAAALCPEPYGVADVSPIVPAEESAATSVANHSGADMAAAPERNTCATDGIAMISAYEWTAGLSSYGEDRDGARHWLVNHVVGHLHGYEDLPCEAGEAHLMADQRNLPETCTPNPYWVPIASGADVESP